MGMGWVKGHWGEAGQGTGKPWAGSSRGHESTRMMAGLGVRKKTINQGPCHSEGQWGSQEAYKQLQQGGVVVGTGKWLKAKKSRTFHMKVGKQGLEVALGREEVISLKE